MLGNARKLVLLATVFVVGFCVYQSVAEAG
jgi:hypothetical protein